MKTKEFKALLTEWNQNFLIENKMISLKQLKQKIVSSRNLNPPEQDKIFKYLDKNYKILRKFTNVILTDLEKTREPVPEIFNAIINFNPYYNAVDDVFKKRIIKGEITSSELRGFYESKIEEKKSENRTKNRIELRSQIDVNKKMIWSENSSNEAQDFEVIYSGDDWLVIYPKTILGSISWAVGLADGSEEVYEVDEIGTQIGRVTWCTAAYENNRFDMYAGNLHVYYLIKRSGYNINDINRRICISITKSEEENNVSIDLKGGATVNAKNESIGSEEEINDIVKNQTIIDTIKAHALTKKATSVSEMASKATLKIVKQDEENLKDDKDSRNNQIAVYLKYTKDLEAIEYIIQKYKNEYIDDPEWDEINLPLKVFQREDIVSLDKEIDVINKFLTLYSDNLEALHDVWAFIIYVIREFDAHEMVSKDTNLRKKLLQFSIESIKNKSEKQNPFNGIMSYYGISPEEMEALTTAVVNFGHQSNSATWLISSLIHFIDSYTYSYGTFGLHKPEYKTSVDNLRKLLNDPSFFGVAAFKEMIKDNDDLKILLESKGNKILKQYIKTLLN